MKKQFAANIALVFTALIWGLSFVAQRSGMEYVGPYTFNAVRSFLGSLSLLPVIAFFKLLYADTRTDEEKHNQHKDLFKGGIFCGIALFLAMTIQQYCMQYVPAGKAGFISALYLIFVPLIAVFMGKKIHKLLVISLLMAIIGLYLLCFKSDASFNIYDLILLVSAFFYGIHIIVVAHFSRQSNAAKLSCFQFFVVGVLSSLLALVFETPLLSAIWDCKIHLFFAGVVTCGVAYTLQIFGQKNTPPIVASLIMSLESVFAVLGGMLLLNETLSLRELSGCLLMIAAVILSKLKPQALYPGDSNTKD